MYRLGFGTLRLPKSAEESALIDLVRYAYKEKITYFDCAPNYCDGKCEKIVGRAVKDFRTNVILASKIPLDVLKKPGDLHRMLERSLENLQTEYLDYYFLWGIKKKEFEEVAIGKSFLQEMQQAKEEGLIHNIAFSFHDKAEYSMDIIEKAEQYGCPFDAMLCQYNMIDRSMEPWIAKAKSEGLVNLVMGAAAGGKLNYEIAYPFVWNNPNVDCLLSGFQNIDMVRENIEMERTFGGIRTDDYNKIEAELRQKEVLKHMYCTGCGYCMPCPAGVNIPEVMNQLQKHYYDKYQYNLVENVCIQCGQCEKKCPQNLPIRKCMNGIQI